MPRKHLIRTDDFPYHITTRSRNKDWYELPMEQVWKIYLDSIHSALKKYPAKIHAFVLMSNHYHLLISSRGRNIDQFMFELNRNVSLKIRQKAIRINQIFGGRYKWSLVEDSKYLYNVYKYIFRNPVKAGHCQKCEDYPFSTLTSPHALPIDQQIETLSAEFLSWINLGISEEEDLAIKTGLSKAVFLPAQNPLNKKTIELGLFI